jgi:hypothetical protein
MPRIDEIIDRLGSGSIFSTIDLASGFHQIPLAKESRPLTSFSTPKGSYQFTRAPFGLKVIPNSFQRMMSLAFKNIDYAFPYIDDLVITGSSKETHLKNLEENFKICRSKNLKLN